MASAKLEAQIVATDLASKVFQSVQKKSEEMAKSFGNASKQVAVAAGAVALGVFGFAKQAIDGASKAEQLKVAFTTMIGNAKVAEQTLASLTKFAASTPFELPEVQESAKKLLAFGIAAKDIEPTLRQLGDVSAGIGAPLGDIAYLFGTIKTQGVAMTQDVRQFAARGIPIYEALATVMKTNTEHVGELITAGKVGFPEIQKAFGEMTKEGSKFGGLMELQSKTFGGTMSNLGDTIGQLMTEIGTAMLPTLKALAEHVAAALDWFKNLDPGIKNTIAQVILFVGAIAGVIAVFGTLGAAIPGIVAAIGTIAAALLFLATNPVGILITALAGLAIWFASTGVTWEQFVLSMQAVWIGVVIAIIEKVNWLKDRWIDAMVSMGQVTEEEGERMKKANADYLGDMEDEQVKIGNRLIEIEKEKRQKQREIAEDELAKMVDKVKNSTGDQKKWAIANLALMKANYEREWPDIVARSGEQLKNYREKVAGETALAAQEALKNQQAMKAKFIENLKGLATEGSVWGGHFIQNFAASIGANRGLVAAAVTSVKAIMEKLKFSKNPEIPSEIWGQHFIENFAAGMKESEPDVVQQTGKLKEILKAQFGSDGEIQNLLKEWTKDKSIESKFAEISAKVKEQSEKINQEFESQKADYQDLNLSAGQALADLKKKHEDDLGAINKKIEDTKKQIQDLNKNYKINIQSEDSGLGAEVVKQQDLVAELQKQIKDKQEAFAKASTSAQTQNQSADEIAQTKKQYEDELKELQDKYNKEFSALSNFMATAKGLEDEIKEARRRSNLTEFERFIEDTNNRKLALAQEYEEKLALLEEEKKSLQDQRDKENVIYTAKMQQFSQVQASFKQMQNTFTSGLSTMATEAQKKVDFINQKLSQMKSALDQISKIQEGGGTPTTLTGSNIPRYADGGIVSRPTVAMIGEGGMNEAVVPLPNGRSIPVQFNGDTGKKININLNFGDVNISKEVDADGFFKEMEDRLTRLIQLQSLGSIA